MSAQHWTVIAALIIAIGTQLSAVQHPEELYSPTFIGGLLIQVGTTIAALLVGSPIPRTPWTDEERLEHNRR